MTDGILASIEVKDKIYRRYLLTPLDCELKNKLKIEFKLFSTILRRVIRRAKINYYNQIFERDKFDIRKTWSSINTLLGRKKSSVKSDIFVSDGKKLQILMKLLQNSMISSRVLDMNFVIS